MSYTWKRGPLRWEFLRGGVVTNHPTAPVDLLEEIIAAVVDVRGSDIHIGSHGCPFVRIDGEIHPLEEFPIAPAWTASLLDSILAAEHSEVFSTRRSLDFSYTSAGGERFRVNAYFQRGCPALAIRRLDGSFKSIRQLCLPQEFQALGNFDNGLVLVTGPTGSGKSTSLAALLHEINRSRACHILTIEDPIEHLHENHRSIVTQREVHTDVPSFADAVRMALREDPDVILVGEMRDLDTIRAAVTAAETGHLVFSTLHTNDCVGSVDRMISSFPAEEQDYAREQLSRVLRAVVSQRLVPRSDAPGRVPIQEIMRVHHAVANLIRLGQVHQIPSAMQTSMHDGTLLLEQSLADQVVAGRISIDTARTWARDLSILDARLEMVDSCRSLAGTVSSSC